MIKTLYITRGNQNEFRKSCTLTLDLDNHPEFNGVTTSYQLENTIREFLDAEKVDKIDIAVLDETSYEQFLNTKKLIDTFSWELRPTVLRSIDKIIVVDTSQVKYLEEGLQYLEILKTARDVSDVKYEIINISEWQKIKSAYDNSKFIALDFEASSLYPQQTSFYIGGIGLYDGKTAFYVWDNDLSTRLSGDIKCKRQEWVDLGNYLNSNDRTIIMYNLGYENKVFATRLGGVIKKPQDVLADLRCLVKSGSLKVTAVKLLGVPDWADDVQTYVQHTNVLMGLLKVRSRGSFKWYKRFVDENDQPSLRHLINQCNDLVLEIAEKDIDKQLVGFEDYLKTSSKDRVIQDEDILFSSKAYRIYVKDVMPELVGKTPMEFGMFHDDLVKSIRNKLKVDDKAMYLYQHELSGKDFSVSDNLNLVLNVLNKWNVSLDDYEKLLLKLFETGEDCKYTDTPLELCAKYCITDTVNTYNLFQVTKLEIKSRCIELASDIYQQQDVLADRMERACLAWDDKFACKHQEIYISTALSSLKKLFLSPRGMKVLKLTPAQILEVETTQDVEVLKGYLNPSSYTEDVKKKFSYLFIDPVVKMAYMYYMLHTAKLSHPGDEDKWFKAEYPTLSKYYSKMEEMYGFYENYGKAEDTVDENGNKVEGKKLTVNDLPREEVEKYLKDLRDELKRQADSFNLIFDECIETRKQQGFKFEGDNDKQEFILLNDVRNFSLPGTSASTIEWMYEVYTKGTGVDPELDWTWTECFWNLYHFRMYKKVMKSNTTYIEGTPGRQAVIRSVSPHEADTVEFDKFYYDIEDKSQDGNGWLVKSQFASNVAETKRWKSTQHVTPWKSENMDRRTSRFRENGIRIHYDYSQAEIRVMARASGDEAMLNAFYKDADIHRFVASRVHNKKEEEVTEAERRFAKMASFSILYGKTEIGMANDFMQGDVERARKLFNDFYTAFPKVKEFIHKKHMEALTYGKITTIFGDFIDVGMPDFALELPIESKKKLIDNAFDKSLKLDRDSMMAIAGALRHAQNYPIQSASSSLAAMGIKGLWDHFLKIGSPAKIDCFTHDSCDIDAPICDVYEIMKAIPEIAVKGPREKYGIPMKVDIDWSTHGDHPVEMEGLEFDDETKTIKAEFAGKREGFDWLVNRLKNYGVKVEYEFTKEKTKGVMMKELFITRRAFSLDIGKQLPYVEGKISMSFANLEKKY